VKPPIIEAETLRIEFTDASDREPGFVRAAVKACTLDGAGPVVVEAYGHGHVRAEAFALQAYAEHLLRAHPREFPARSTMDHDSYSANRLR
jgi:hypothetical protein